MDGKYGSRGPIPVLNTIIECTPPYTLAIKNQLVLRHIEVVPYVLWNKRHSNSN